MIENTNRERIVQHVDFEDILYVMGKGDKLKIGYIVNLPGSRQPADFRTEFITDGRLAGHKARSIAEDIIAYSQLRLAEMTKNGYVEFHARAKHLYEKSNAEAKIRMNSVDTEEDNDPLHLHLDLAHAADKSPMNQPSYQRQASSTFKGLQDMQMKQEELLDSFDLGENDSIMNGLGQTRITGEKLTASSPAETYAKDINN